MAVVIRTILTVLFAIDCIALVVVVLMQQGKDQGLGALAGAAVLADTLRAVCHDDQLILTGALHRVIGTAAAIHGACRIDGYGLKIAVAPLGRRVPEGFDAHDEKAPMIRADIHAGEELVDLLRRCLRIKGRTQEPLQNIRALLGKNC